MNLNHLHSVDLNLKSLIAIIRLISFDIAYREDIYTGNKDECLIELLLSEVGQYYGLKKSQEIKELLLREDYIQSIKLIKELISE